MVELMEHKFLPFSFEKETLNNFDVVYYNVQFLDNFGEIKKGESFIWVNLMINENCIQCSKKESDGGSIEIEIEILKVRAIKTKYWNEFNFKYE